MSRKTEPIGIVSSVLEAGSGTSPAQDVLQIQFKDTTKRYRYLKVAPVYDSWDVGYLLALPSPAVRFVIVPFAFDFVVDNIVLCIPCVQSRTATREGERETKTKLSSE